MPTTHSAKLPFLLALAVSLALLGGCKSAYYGTLEKFGKHKRDLLVDRVEAARDDQEEAKEQFQDALTRFSELTHFKGGDLEKTYKQLDSEYQDSASKAESVSERIRSIEEVAKDLFEEWREELGQYESRELRQSSERQLKDTEKRYGELIGAMHRAEQKMKPVLAAFHDQVLFLKHNLNAQAIASLQGQVVELESDVARLIADMDAAIKEANAFIDQMSRS
jgi:DNA repair exonuclease SbcCD ATPase subunit